MWRHGQCRPAQHQHPTRSADTGEAAGHRQIPRPRRTKGTKGAEPMSQPTAKKRRRERGDDGISWDKINKCYLGTISLGFDAAGKRLRRTVRGKTKAEVKD